MKEYLKLLIPIFCTGSGLYQTLNNYSEGRYIKRPTSHDMFVHNMGTFFVYACPFTLPLAYYLKYKE